MNYVLDTNIIIYLLQGRLLEELPRHAQFWISVISELEVLSYPDLTAAEEISAQLFFKKVVSVELSSDIKQLTIDFRRRYRLKLPDALIVATAKSLQAVLLTNDLKLTKIPDLVSQQMDVHIS